MRDLTHTRDGKSHLEGGFMLRCFQHLSLPHVATQRCSWRNNWYTSGVRSEERRVGKERRSRGAAGDEKGRERRGVPDVPDEKSRYVALGTHATASREGV